MLKMLLTLVLVAIPFSAIAASFTCSKAQTKVEKLICNSPELSGLDDQLGKTYRDVLARCRGDQRKKLVAEQQQWLKAIRNLCPDSSCLIRAYSNRIAEVLSFSDSRNAESETADKNFCASITMVLTQKTAIKKASSRPLTEQEDALLQSQELDFFSLPADFGAGIEVVDVDNDGEDEVFAYTIAGSDRVVSIAAFDFPSNKRKNQMIHELFVSINGVLDEPYFINHRNRNYLISSDGGSGKIVTEFIKSSEQYQQITRCKTSVKMNVLSTCDQPVCNALKSRIGKNAEDEFTAEVWPHKYFPPFGAQVFTHDNPVEIDYDNSGKIRYLWKLGREGYMYENIYWSWMGEGGRDTAPKTSRPESDTNEPRDILPGEKHDNLRKTIKQHEELLKMNGFLKPAEKLLKAGEFFFLGHSGSNYWVWGIGDDASWGKSMHIILTRSGRSKYMGAVTTSLTNLLVPCKKECVQKFE